MWTHQFICLFPVLKNQPPGMPQPKEMIHGPFLGMVIVFPLEKSGAF